MTHLPLVLRHEAIVHAPPDGPVVVTAPWARVTLGDVGSGMRAALDRLAGDGATEPELADLVAAADGSAALATLYFALQRAAAHRLLGVTASLGGNRVATAVPMTAAPVPAAVAIGPADRVRLSRFAFAQRGDDAGTLIVESPRSPVRVLLHGERGGALLAALAAPIGITDVAATETEAEAVLGLLVAAGIAGVTDEHGTIPAEDTPALRQWEFHDLLFHARVRRGRHDLPYGGTYRFQGDLPPPPAVVPVATDRVTIALPGATGTTPSLDDVLAARRSTRGAGASPLTIDHLGGLLQRAAVVQEQLAAHGDRPYDVTRRPYPGAGAAYELELYPVVHRCTGLDPGLYRYDPADHRLVVVAPPDARTDRLLDDAVASAVMAERPEVLIVITARFARLSWKYAAIAYSLLLKDVGVLLGTMTLVATSMGIGASALGGGDADLFAAVAGTDYDAETSVGELIVGGPR